ncbi:hypothetical protein [Nocardioides sp. J54]|uniref:hypothetical protein n=1 Tax=Nocardioides sp. J54 TaxID=935866 RepID=UPI0004B40B30|nr:hypothetical protein [Nocardioides sp. J54]
MKVTIEKKTDQLNYEDFLGGVTRIVTIAGIKKGTKEQQYDIEIVGDSRVWRPAVTVLKLLVAAWGDDASTWIGRHVELYGDPDVTFGREKVGGIRVSRLSHIDGPVAASLTETRGRRKVHIVEPLDRVSILRAEWTTATPERKAEIEAEVKSLTQPTEGGAA